MKKLNAAVDRFAYRHPNFGIPNLMRLIVFGNAVVYLLYFFAGRNYGVISFLAFDLAHLLQGELWRLLTFVFVPFTFQPISFLIMLSFYYFVGNALERAWGTAKFTLYYLSGMLLSVLVTVLAALLTGYWGYSLAGTHYINLTLFLAFAMLYPDAQVLLYFFIPLKVKWIAWFDVALLALNVLGAIASGDLMGCLLPIIAIMNFLVFFWEDMSRFLDDWTGKTKHRTSKKTVQFHQAARQQKQREAVRGYRHKCTVCGRTDADFPDVAFRYCSRCAGYHCYCEEHIFNHEHFTE